MKNGEKWVALAALVASYACATGVTLSEGEDVNILQLDQSQDGGAGLGPALGGSSGSGPASGGSGPGSGGGSGGTTGGAGGSSQGGTASAVGGAGGAPPAQGGAGGALAQGGSPGAGGTETLPPAPTGECVETPTLQVLFTESSSANQIGITLTVQQPAGTTYPLSDLTLRYWFDDDNFTGYVGTVFYQIQNQTAGTPTPGATVTFAEGQGVSYAEFHFSSTNPIANGIESVQVGIHSTPYQTLDFTNDWSFIDNATATPNDHISAYVAGVQVFGCEPPDP